MMMPQYSVKWSEVRALQKSLALSIQRLRHLQAQATKRRDTEQLGLTDQLIDNAMTYSVFLDECLRGIGIKEGERARKMIDQIGEHCRLVNQAYQEQQEEPSGAQAS